MKHLFPKVAIAFTIVLITACVAEKASAEWNESTQTKYENLISIGMPKDVANSLLTHCKALATDPAHCVKIGASILGAESSLGNRCHKNNCTWIEAGKIAYATKDEWIKDWVKRYIKFWFRRPNPDHFYSNSPDRLPATRYCMDEHSSGSKGYCPNGNMHAWKTFNSLEF